jgi:hypothetical protein
MDFMNNDNDINHLSSTFAHVFMEYNIHEFILYIIWIDIHGAVEINIEFLLALQKGWIFYIFILCSFSFHI